MDQGYPAVYIKNLFGISYNTIRRYKEGDPDLLCRFPKKQGVGNMIDKHKAFIIESMNRKMSFAAILREINKTGTSIKRTAFNKYCRKIKDEYNINNKINIMGKELILSPVKARYIKRKDILLYLWTGSGLSAEDYEHISKKYEVIWYLKSFIVDFKSVFEEKEKVMLAGFVEIYEDSVHRRIKSFIKGLVADIKAVENAVCLPYSNGFVEGNNNRLKMIKRMMYGRAKLPLLKTKFIYGN